MTALTKSALIVTMTCLTASAAVLAESEAVRPATQTASRVSDFSLLDQNGVFHQLSRLQHKKAVVVMSYDASCASDKQAVDGLDQIRKNWESKDVAFVLMNSKLKQDRNAVREAALNSKVDFTILMDHAQLVAESLGIQTSGSIVVLDPETTQLLYKGPVNSQITKVLEAKLAGKAEPVKALPVQGCAIDFPGKKLHAAKVPDYSKDIAPIIKDNCAMCHHEGGIGPFAMNSYNMMKGWSPMIREVLLTKRMPPMQVDPNISHFSNARYVSDKDLQTLVHWVDAGSPRGTGKEDPLTKLHYGNLRDWQLGKPDFIVTAKAHDVPAVGVIDYINDDVELSFNEDKWVRAVQFIPGAPSVLHHILTYVTGPKETFDGGEGGAGGRNQVARRFLEGYAPGKIDAMTFPKDTGVFIPKGHKLSMQFHYTANGKAATDQTIVGLYFYDKPPKYEYLNLSVSGQFKIPPHARDHKAAGDHVFTEDVIVHGLRAHMHFRGHDMKFTADLPDGTKKELLSVPNYSYAWQPTYQLIEPVTLPAGTKVHVTGAFDNSKWNPANPDPSKELTFGLQSWDEMFIGYWSYTTVKPANRLSNTGQSQR
ncbi:MAG: redoxin domain-containing protein [Candidatus Obscuribacterales bacterium]|nr:redoxin domain-containing protein [Steroidobacteraceae bacterium]